MTEEVSASGIAPFGRWDGLSLGRIHSTSRREETSCEDRYGLNLCWRWSWEAAVGLSTSSDAMSNSSEQIGYYFVPIIAGI